MISGAVTEMCGSQMSFDMFNELQHSWHKVLPLQGWGEEVLLEQEGSGSWDVVWD